MAPDCGKESRSVVRNKLPRTLLCPLGARFSVSLVHAHYTKDLSISVNCMLSILDQINDIVTKASSGLHSEGHPS